MLKKLLFSKEKKQTDQDNITKNESYGNNNKSFDQVINDTKATLRLHEEQLDIVKKWVKTGDVDIHKEVLTEEKTLTVPVTREELVVEKKFLDKTSDGNVEVIRIPIREEQIEVTKHWVVLEDVQIYKNQFQENKSIEETLKREELHLETTGNPKITNIETKTPY